MAIKDDPIKHVILLKLENHSFDQMLGYLKNDLYPDIEGASESNFNVDSKGKKFSQVPMDYPQMEIDPNHEHVHVIEQLSNSNGGFVRNLERVKGCTESHKAKIMAYYPKGSLIALHKLAENFTVCDNWFSSVPGPTWPNRFFALTGTTQGFVKMPENNENFEMLLNQNQTTIFDRLNEKNKKWNVFYYDMPCSLILWNQRRPENVKNYALIEDFFDLCENGKEKDFPDFAFIEPKYFGTDQNDDHPPHNVMKAQKLIADVYTALNSNQELFESTLFIIVYDEHGGFYDHVIPPKAIAPDTRADQYTFDQYGLRVPAILISPYVKQGIDKTLYDHTSILKYLIEKWDLGPFGERTATANSIGNSIQETPRSYADLPGFIRIPYSKLVTDNPEIEEKASNGHQDALELFWMTIESGSLAVGVESLKETMSAWSSDTSRLANIYYWLGTFLVAAGRFFQSKGKAEIRDKNSQKLEPAKLRSLSI